MSQAASQNLTNISKKRWSVIFAIVFLLLAVCGPRRGEVSGGPLWRGVPRLLPPDTAVLAALQLLQLAAIRIGGNQVSAHRGEAPGAWGHGSGDSDCVNETPRG